jgi:hypothetical protein
MTHIGEKSYKVAIDFLQKSHFYLAQGVVPMLGAFPAAGDCGGALMQEV